MRNGDFAMTNPRHSSESYESSELLLDCEPFVLPLTQGRVISDWSTVVTNAESFSTNETTVFSISSFTLPAPAALVAGQSGELSAICTETDTAAVVLPCSVNLNNDASYKNLNHDITSCSFKDISMIHNPSDELADWLLPSLTEQQRSFSSRKRGRPRKCLRDSSTKMVYCANYDPSFLSYSQFNHTDLFWCPLCHSFRQSEGCSDHPLSVQSDPVVESYARLSRPSFIRIVEKSGFTCVCVGKKQLPLTRFGPLVGPTVTQAELNANPNWLPHCGFPIEVAHDGKTVTNYFCLMDEARCNWMMFVRLVVKSPDNCDPAYPIPNAVAYQQCTKGIFFLTTRTIAVGEEIVVTYAPLYAARFGLPQSLIATEYPPLSVRQSQQERVMFKPVPDEIHCFRCTLTFHSEDAFRIHCLGHPGEFERRGISTCQKQVGGDGLSEVSLIEIRHADGMIKNYKKNPTFVQSMLVCSLCSSEVQDLPELIRHTDARHSVLRPCIFKPKSFSSLIKFLSAPGFDVTDSTETSSVRLDDSLQSENDFLSSDLTRISPSLPDGPLYAFGCGQCREQFGAMHLLEQHKQSSHQPIAELTTVLSTEFDNVPSPFAHITHSPLIDSDLVECSNSTQVMTSTERQNWSSLQLKASNDAENAHSPFPSVSMPVSAPMAVSDSQLSDQLPPVHSCDICGIHCRTRSALAVHMRSHFCESTPPLKAVTEVKCTQHVEQSPTACSRLRPRSTVGVKRYFFRCGVCGEGQRNQKALQDHHVKHQRQSDRLFPCLICPEAYNRAYPTFAQLQRHIRFVHPKKIFPCPYCSRTFGRRQHLTNHLAQHTGRRDFVCPHVDCMKAYSRKDKLKDHLKTHVYSSSSTGHK